MHVEIAYPDADDSRPCIYIDLDSIEFGLSLEEACELRMKLGAALDTIMCPPPRTVPVREFSRGW